MIESIIRIEGKYYNGTFKGFKETLQGNWITGQKEYIDSIVLKHGKFYKYFSNESELKLWIKNQIVNVEIEPIKQ